MKNLESSDCFELPSSVPVHLLR